ncbi:hypothetical protein [Brevibacillus thermoruber]|uniref:hypothetical protein n=1 Tax=Brevibacillus thermoruber TaxID=33942 RepID=UPI0012E07D87|nr:hypothetical protein [Brevibacillus thermoruber]
MFSRQRDHAGQAMPSGMMATPIPCSRLTGSPGTAREEKTAVGGSAACGCP